MLALPLLADATKVVNTLYSGVLNCESTGTTRRIEYKEGTGCNQVSCGGLAGSFDLSQFLLVHLLAPVRVLLVMSGLVLVRCGMHSQIMGERMTTAYYYTMVCGTTTTTSTTIGSPTG